MIENLPNAITPQVTHLKDPDMFWDFISLMPMTTHQVKCFVVCPRNLPWNDKSPCSWSSPWSQFSFFLSYQVQDVDAGNAMILWYQVSFLFSDRGTPNGYRFMNGYNWKVKVAKKKRNHSFNQIWLAHVQDGERGQRGGVLQVPLQDRPGHQVLWQVGRGHRHNHCHCQDETISIILMILFYRHQADEMAKQDPDYAIRWTHQIVINMIQFCQFVISFLFSV